MRIHITRLHFTQTGIETIQGGSSLALLVAPVSAKTQQARLRTMP
jgi:hypothetical protein